MSIINDGEIAAAALKYLAPETIEAAEHAAGRLLSETFETLQQTAGRFAEHWGFEESEAPIASPDWIPLDQIPPDKIPPSTHVVEWSPGPTHEPSVDELREDAQRYVERFPREEEITVPNSGFHGPEVKPTAANSDDRLSGPEPIEGNYNSFDGEWHSRRRY